jgi:hypothetical protein
VWGPHWKVLVTLLNRLMLRLRLMALAGFLDLQARPCAETLRLQG